MPYWSVPRPSGWKLSMLPEEELRAPARFGKPVMADSKRGMLDTRSVEDRIRQLRLRAEEARTLGEALDSAGEARRLLLGVAANYDRLADYIESPGKPNGQREDVAG